jgi:hypothetical protein
MKYEVIAENLWDADIGSYTAYGVLARDCQGNNVLKVSDVFTDKSDAEAFVEKCNSLDLDIIHIYDVIEDTMG